MPRAFNERVKADPFFIKTTTLLFSAALLVLVCSDVSSLFPNFRNSTSSVISRFLAESENVNVTASSVIVRGSDVCLGLHDDHIVDPCAFLNENPQCSSDGLFDYVKFFYCTCGTFRFLGYFVLAIWLAALFYLLGNTAADYFCSSLEKLSGLLRLPPTVAGVVLLPLGNGAPDVFSSIASFVGNGSGNVGLNSVLGGACFVTCVVVGIVSLCVAEKGVRIDRRCFIRDVCFFLFTLVSLSLILIMGKVTVGVAVGFLCIYVVYALVVAASEIARFDDTSSSTFDAVTPLLPVVGSLFSRGNSDDDISLYSSLLPENEENHFHSLPQWMWASNVAIYSNKASLSGSEWPTLGWNDEGLYNERPTSVWSKLITVLELPLVLPRRLTIPLVEEETWYKPYAVASALLAPVLLAVLWGSGNDIGSVTKTFLYLSGVVGGGVLGFLAYKHTEPDRPPQRYLFPWVFGGFFMSIIWFYIIANELVSLLVGIGSILGINPSILGLTVLAWGNSMGDLMSNVALAMHGGDSAQIAFSGSYAGPMFNTLAGLGISMLIGAASDTSGSYILPQDRTIIYTMGFLMSGLIWALFILPKNNMRPSITLGAGLIFLYVIFLVVRVSCAVGLIPFSGVS